MPDETNTTTATTSPAPVPETAPSAVPEPAIAPPLEPAEAVMKGKTPTCPHCSSKLVVYVGENLLKVGTAFCERCGLRHKLS